MFMGFEAVNWGPMHTSPTVCPLSHFPGAAEVAASGGEKRPSDLKGKLT